MVHGSKQYHSKSEKAVGNIVVCSICDKMFRGRVLREVQYRADTHVALQHGSGSTGAALTLDPFADPDWKCKSNTPSKKNAMSIMLKGLRAGERQEREEGSVIAYDLD
jgi:hypothetical protein